MTTTPEALRLAREALPAISPHDHPEHHAMVWTEREIAWIADYAARAVVAASTRSANVSKSAPGIDTSSAPSGEPAEPAVPWPTVVAYAGGRDAGGVGAWLEVSMGDGPEDVHRYVRATTQAAPAPQVSADQAQAGARAWMEAMADPDMAPTDKAAHVYRAMRALSAQAAPAPRALTDAAEGAISRTGPDLLKLAQEWADNKLHTYAFAHRAEGIVRRAVLAAAGITAPTATGGKG